MTVSIIEIAQSVRTGSVSAEEIMVQTLERISAYDAIQPQAWISRCADQDLLEAARAVDERINSGEVLKLAGVPFAVKDNIDVIGLPTTAACPDFAYQPEKSASVVAVLVAAGAICVGKTNLDQFATGLNGTRTPYGIPTCVYNGEMISGGSSSGSGVVVGAGLVPFSLGTDTAGSGRVPAAVNGCVGYKPSKGRWSTTGLLPACRTIDCITVFTADVASAVLVDDVVAGYDGTDSYSREIPIAARSALQPVFAIPQPDQLEFFGDVESADMFAAAVDRCRALGGTVVEIDISPLLEAGKLLYGGPYVAERYAAVGDFIDSHPDAAHPVVASIIKNGLQYSAVDYFRSAYVMQDLMLQAGAMWDQADALILPTAPTCFSIEAMLAEPYLLNARMGHYTAAINLLDMAAIALPAGYRSDNTGFGISLIGPAHADAALFDLAERYMAETSPDRPALDTKRRGAVALAVVGAHLHGMPLHWQLTSRDAQLLAKTQTAPEYKLYAMAGTTPPKPALIHSGNGGTSIEVEIYALSVEHFGSFVANVPPPLAIGTLTLADGSQVKGFVAEPRAMEGAADVSKFGSWRNYIQQRS